MSSDRSDENLPSGRGLLAGPQRRTAWALAAGVVLVPALASIAVGTAGDWLWWSLLALWAATVSVDERAFGPLIWHQPIVAASVTGWILGQPAAGLATGFVLQLIWPGLLPLGGVRQPVVSMAAVLGAAWMSLWPLGDLSSRALVGITAALIGSSWGEWGECRLRRRNERRETRVYAAGAADRRASIGQLAWCGLMESAALGVVTVLGFILLPLCVMRGLGSEPLMRGASLATMLPGVGTFSTVRATESILAAWGVVAVLWFSLGGIFGQRARAIRNELQRIGHGIRGQAFDTHLPASSKSRGTREPPGHCLTGRQWRALLTLQATFSFRHLQRGGFLGFLAALPRGRFRGSSNQALLDLEEDLARQGTANTQPVIAAALYGGLERVLSDAAHEPLPRSPLKLLTVGGAVLAQWADRTLWGGLRPALGLIALWCLLEEPVWVLVAYALLGLGLHIGARIGFYRWGWRLGWDLVRGGGGWTWRWLPSVLSLAVPVLALLLTVALAHRLGGFLGPTIGTDSWLRSFFRQGGVWFILGLPLGYLLGRRALMWGWLCGLIGWAAWFLSGASG